MQRNKPAVEIFDGLPSGSANLKSFDYRQVSLQLQEKNI
jgi:hypothetical protein